MPAVLLRRPTLRRQTFLLPLIHCFAESASSPEDEEHVQEQAAQQHYAQQEHQQQPNDQQAQTQQQAGKAGKRGPSALGLQLAVGSHMETGEWKSNGVWVKKEKQEQAVPNNLQVIPAEDLVKVSCSSVDMQHS